MFDWIKNIAKEYPEFYKDYIATFEQRTRRFVVLNLHGSGTGEHDVIYQLAAVGVEQKSVVVSDAFSVVIPQYKYLHDNGISTEFLLENPAEKLSEETLLPPLLGYLSNAVLVGYRIEWQVEMLNRLLEKHDCGRLRNEALDIEIMHRKLKNTTDTTHPLSELRQIYHIPQQIGDADPTDEAFAIALLFVKFRSRLGIQ